MGRPTKRDIRPSLAAEAWAPLAAIFTNWSGVRPRGSWFRNGMSERVGSQRMARLLRSREAVRFDAAVAGLGRGDLKRLHDMARINLEQAQAASRVTIFLNVTVVLGALVLLNQLAPGMISELWREGDDALRTTIVTGFVILATVWITVSAYSWGGVAAARDLKHLLEVRLAGTLPGLADADEGEAGDAASDLRAAQLSDL